MESTDKLKDLLGYSQLIHPEGLISEILQTLPQGRSIKSKFNLTKIDPLFILLPVTMNV